jgi:E3 ubiquitin-protein ligase CHFR
LILMLVSWTRPSFPAVPADSAFPEVEVAEDDAVVCSLMSPSSGEELAWCEIRRGGDASSTTIRNLR